MEREVGGGIGMGNTCKPMAVSFQCMTKSTTIKKKKRLQDISVMVIHSVWLGRVFKMDPEENAFGKVGGCFLPCLRALDFIL